MQSYPFLRRLFHVPELAVSISYEGEEFDQEDDLESSIRRAVLEDSGPSLAVEPTLEEFSLGRSAGYGAVIVSFGAGLLTLLGGITAIHEGAKILKIWGQFLRNVAKRWESAGFSVDALKLLSVNELLQQYGDKTEPLVESIVHTVGAAPIGDGSWHQITPIYILIPDRLRKSTHLFVMTRGGETLHRAELPLYEIVPDDEDLRCAPTSTLAAPEDPYPPRTD